MSRSSTTKLFDALERELGPLQDREIDRAFVNVAVNLGRIRRRANWTQTELAKQVGTSQPRIAEIEGAQSNPTLRTLARIAHALGVTLSALVADNKSEERALELHLELGTESEPTIERHWEFNHSSEILVHYDTVKDWKSYVAADNLAAVA